MPAPSRAARLLALALVVAFVAALFLAATPKPDPTTIDPIAAVADSSLALRGKVVYVDFWASWCVPCRHSFPWMSAMLEKYQSRGLRIVTVNLDPKSKAARKFMREMNTSLPVVFDSTGVFAKLYKLEAMPTSFLYGRDGKLIERTEGFHDEHALQTENTIESLLDEKGKK
jgi:thiol-disulfide isomerase/thioredoxin